MPARQPRGQLSDPMSEPHGLVRVCRPGINPDLQMLYLSKRKVVNGHESHQSSKIKSTTVEIEAKKFSAHMEVDSISAIEYIGSFLMNDSTGT